VTSGDLGTEPSTAEKKLQEIFKLAYAWKAILLLDEADVFLAKRGTDDVVRNAFVTIFLRVMEYYPGIMILTTNRRDALDEAFLSRIHLQILYPAATPAQRKVIWANIDHAQHTAHTLTDEVFERLGTRYERNGREIKNLVSMAILTAKSQRKALDETVVNAVCDMHARFQGTSSSFVENE
jgi:SpoVK/Ycf46/Vps4 family AAA+-type ATPase